MKVSTLEVSTNGERFYDITDQVKNHLQKILLPHQKSGICYFFLMHTSCALTISESYDPSARVDLENFLKHLAPRNASYITHTTEGEDDSPSHMKSALLQQSLCLPVEDQTLLLGTWQGIYLCEFRDHSKTRKVLIKFIPDSDH